MSETKPSLIDNFKGLSSGARNGIILGFFVILLFVYGTMTQDDASKTQSRKAPSQTDGFQVLSPGSQAAAEGIASSLTKTDGTVDELKKQIDLLQAQNKQILEEARTDGRWNEIGNLTAQVQAMQDRLNNMQANQNALPQSNQTTTPPDLNAQLPLPGDSAKKRMEPTTSTPPAPPIEIRLVGEEKRVNASAIKKQEPVPYIPSGSNFEAVLLNGMDASTAIGANRNPTPALLRVKSEAILPNLHNFNVRECFVMVGGFGNMSSERVEMRTESMSCIDEKGAVWEGKVEGYLVGEDGKAGARGRMVSKQGALLAKSFMAGFAGGLGSAFTPQEVPTLNLTGGGGNIPYQYPSQDQIIGSGISKGLNQSATALSNFYIKMAEQMFPIVELDAGRKMTIILLKGTELKLDKK